MRLAREHNFYCIYVEGCTLSIRALPAYLQSIIWQTHFHILWTSEHIARPPYLLQAFWGNLHNFSTFDCLLKNDGQNM